MKEENRIAEAKTIFGYCEDLNAENNALFRDDLKFANGDSDNGWMWDSGEIATRKADGRPYLTVNKVRQHNMLIVNELRQNPAQIKVQQIDDSASREVSDMLDGLCRRIQINSDFDQAETVAMQLCVDAGIGYWRVKTDFVDERSADQDVFIEPILDPMSVYLYGNKRPDGSDATHGFVFENLKKEPFEVKYGESAASAITWGGNNDGWLSDDEIRVCEYYYTETKSDTLYFSDSETILLSEADDEVKQQLKQSGLKSRKVERKSVKWCLIAGDKIIDKTDWPGKYIPIVRVAAEEKVIDGRLVRTSNTRAMKDPSRIYNYWTSNAIEQVAMQGKQPYLAPQEAVEGHEQDWNNLNTSNAPYLPYNHKDADGEPVPMPSRQQPAQMAQAYISGMEIASNEIQASSGQYDAQLGQNVNNQSGRALNAVQRRGDTATFHFTDARDRAVRYTGLIILDILPSIYDTRRLSSIIYEDNTDEQVVIDNEQPQPYIEQVDPTTGKKVKSYNISMGRYGVKVSSGASFGTRRQEAAEAMTEIMGRNPQLMQIAGDLMFRSFDSPMMDKIADRLAKTLPPQLQESDEEGSEEQKQQQMQMAMQQSEQKLQEQEQMIKAMDQTIEKMTLELDSKENDSKKLEIDQYNAETNRMKLSPQETQPAPEEDHLLAHLQKRKLEAEAKKVEADAMKAEIEAAKLAKELQEENDEMKNSEQILSALEMLANGIISLQDGMKMACAPRRSEIEFDESGMPISSISRPILHNTNEQMGH